MSDAPVPSLTDQQLLDRWVLRLQKSKRHMQEIHDRMDAYDDAYLRRKPRYGHSEDADWHSKIAPPFAFEQSEVLFAEVTANDVDLTFTAEQLADTQFAKRLTDAIEYYDRRDQVKPKRRRVARWACRYGFGPVKVVRKVETRCAYDEQGQQLTDPDGQPLEEIVYDGPTEIPWNPRKIFPDPVGTCVDEWSYVIFEDEMTLDELEAMDIFDQDGLDELRDLEGAGSQEAKRDTETEEAYRARTEGVHQVHECHTRHGVFTMANKTTMLQRVDAPVYDHGQLPIVLMTLIEDPDSPFGISIIGLIAEIQHAIHELLRRYMDAVNLRVNPPSQVDEEADPNISRYELKPGARIPSNPATKQFAILESVAQIDTMGVDRMIVSLREMMERVTGMNASLSGGADDPTATQSAINLRQGKGRVGAQIETYNTGWARVAWLKYKILQQFLDERVVALASGGQQIEFGPEELAYDYMVEPSASSEKAVKDLLRQDMTTVMQTLLAAALPQDIASLNWKELFSKYLESFDIKADGIVGDPPAPQMPPPGPGGPPPGDPGAGGPAPGQLPPGPPPPDANGPQLPPVGGQPSPAAFMLPPQGAPAQ